MKIVQTRLLAARPFLLPLAIAAAVFWLAFDGGSYGLESRATLAIAIWWTILVTIVLGLWPVVRPPTAALAAGALLGAFAVLALVSTAWAASAERAFTEFNRSTLYVGVFLVAVLAGTRGNLARVIDGIGAGIAVVGLLALASRLFPDWLPAGQVPEFLPSAYARLSWPVEYWNALGILVGLGLPLLLRGATAAHAPFWRALALVPVPGLVAALYLTSSRGGFATAIVGLAAFFALTPRRWAAGAAILVAGAGAVAAIAILVPRDALVNDPYDSPVAVTEGRSAALLLLLVSVGVGLVHWLGVRYAGPRVRLPAAAGYAALAVVVLAAAAGIAAADPVGRVEAFQQPPADPAEFAEDGFVQAHLLSGNGSGRWQFWGSAIDQFDANPLVGDGAGSYEAWWA